MRNFNNIALATVLTISAGSTVVHASELGEQEGALTLEYFVPEDTELGRVAISGSLENTSLTETENAPQQAVEQLFDDLLQPVTPTQTAVRIGNQVQLREPPPPPIEPVIIPNFNNWVRLAECESGGDWQINTGNGYYGGLQFNLTSWRAVGGLFFAVRPDLATSEEQMLIAENLLDVQGWGAWPACSRKIGLR